MLSYKYVEVIGHTSPLMRAKIATFVLECKKRMGDVRHFRTFIWETGWENWIKETSK